MQAYASPSASGLLRRCKSTPAPSTASLRCVPHRPAGPVSAALAQPIRQSHGYAAPSTQLSAFVHSQAPAAASRRRAVAVKAGWGAPVEFKPAKITKNSKAATGLHSIIIDVGKEIAAGYTKPGQYVQVKVGDSKPGFFAIASAPDPNNEGSLEFLIKVQPGATAELLANAAAGSDVSVSPVQGKGFPIDRLPADTTDTVLLFASGSGIAPLRAVLTSGVLGQRKEVRLYYGTRDPESTAFLAELPEWEKAGVKVVQVYSSQTGGKYVQDVLEAEPAPAAGGSVGALLCGHKDMCQKVTATLTGRGVPAEKIVLNF